MRVLAQRAVRAPRGQRPRGAPIAVVGLVAGLLGRQVEADDVRRVARRRGARRSSGSMTSYGGATTCARSPTARRVEAQGAEGSDLGHGTLGGRRAGRRLGGRGHRTIAAARPRPAGSVDGDRSGRPRAGATFPGSGRPCCRPPTGPATESACPDRDASLRHAPLCPRLAAVARDPRAWSPLRDRPRPVAAADGLTMEAHALLDGHARRRLVDGHRGPPQERRPADHRRAAARPAAPRAGRGSGRPWTCRRSRTRRSACTPSRRRSGATSRSASSTATTSSPRPRPPSPSTTRPSSSSASSPSGPGDIVGGLDLLPNENNVAPLDVPLDPGGPARAGRGVGRARPARLAGRRLVAAVEGAARGAAAAGSPAGGRLVIVGGTAGPATLVRVPRRRSCRTGRPRPSTSRRARSSPARRRSRRSATDARRAVGGRSAGGRAARDGRRPRRRRRARLRQRLGHDRRLRPDRSWIADTQRWPRACGAGCSRPRSSGGPDPHRRQPARAGRGRSCRRWRCRRSAASSLLLGAYILLIGPINYLVLRRLDRREWAWVTMPVLIVAFAVGRVWLRRPRSAAASVIVNEVAIVRGSPGATDGTAQVYLGVFSPSRGTYQLSVPGGALLSSPINGDVLRRRRHGRPRSTSCRATRRSVRDLAVGFGSLRTIRAETAVERPARSRPTSASRTAASRGRSRTPPTRRSRSRPSSLAARSRVLADLAPGAHGDRRRRRSRPSSSASRSRTRSSARSSSATPSQLGDDAARLYRRHTIVDQLTYDPNFGSTGQLPADGAGHPRLGRPASLLPVEIEGQQPRRTGQRPVLPARPTLAVQRHRPRSAATCIRSHVIDVGRRVLQQGPVQHQLRARQRRRWRTGRSPFEGTFDADRARDRPQLRRRPVGAASSRSRSSRSPRSRTACPDPPTPDCAARPDFDGLPEVELFDLTTPALDAPAASDRRHALRARRPGALRGPGDRHGPRPLRQRPE